jgi:hypothetical protein
MMTGYPCMDQENATLTEATRNQVSTDLPYPLEAEPEPANVTETGQMPAPRSVGPAGSEGYQRRTPVKSVPDVSGQTCR